MCNFDIVQVKSIVFQYTYMNLFYRLHEFDDQVKWVREGMSKVIPVPLLSLFTGLELETMVMSLSFTCMKCSESELDKSCCIHEWHLEECNCLLLSLCTRSVFHL